MKAEDSGGSRVAIVGGGLAGLAAAAILCERGFAVEIFEARRSLGGRAGSFLDTESGELIDHCQHVGMGCCTNLVDFFRRTGIDGLLQRHRVLHFFGPDGRRSDVKASPLLPAPLHLATSLLRLRFLKYHERLGVARAMLKLAREKDRGDSDSPTMGQWLRSNHQSETSIRRFWSLVLVSALGDSVERVSVAAARKVFVDGFLASRRAQEVYTPAAPLGEIYGKRVADWLRDRNVKIHLQSPVNRIVGDGAKLSSVQLDGGEHSCDYVVLATHWKRVGQLLPPPLASAVPALAPVCEIESSPITSLHLWFDRAITPLPHAVLVDRLSQWMFQHGRSSCSENAPAKEHYYQVVISGSRDLRGRSREDVLSEVIDDLTSVWPATSLADLLRWRMITEHDAVFVPTPGIEQFRSPQQTPVPNLMLAGDWTRTGWPATMEGAVRSGYLAAEAILAAAGKPLRVLAPDLPRGWLARLLLGAG